MVQRRAARFVTGNYDSASSVTGMLQHLGWQSLEERRKNARLTTLFKIKHDIVDIPAPDLKTPSRHSRNANENTYTRIQTTKNYRKFSFFPRTVADWNSLPSEITSKTNLGTFSNRLRVAPSIPVSIHWFTKNARTSHHVIIFKTEGRHYLADADYLPVPDRLINYLSTKRWSLVPILRP